MKIEDAEIVESVSKRYNLSVLSVVRKLLMPIYEYRCKKCGHEFEVSQKMKDAPLDKCIKCKGPVKRLISNTAFSLKGGGWYKDGYSSSKTKSGSSPAPSKGSGNKSKD